DTSRHKPPAPAIGASQHLARRSYQNTIQRTHLNRRYIFSLSVLARVGHLAHRGAAAEAGLDALAHRLERDVQHRDDKDAERAGEDHAAEHGGADAAPAEHR